MPPEIEEAERGFWTEVFDGLPEPVRRVVDANPDSVQTAATVGTLLDTFQLENGKLGPYDPLVAVALPKHVTYHIPFMRGSDPAYAEETSSA